MTFAGKLQRRASYWLQDNRRARSETDCIFRFVSGSVGQVHSTEAQVRDYREFHGRVWAGEISLAGDDERVEYARAFEARLNGDAGAAI